MECQAWESDDGVTNIQLSMEDGLKLGMRAIVLRIAPEALHTVAVGNQIPIFEVPKAKK